MPKQRLAFDLAKVVTHLYDFFLISCTQPIKSMAYHKYHYMHRNCLKNFNLGSIQKQITLVTKINILVFKLWKFGIKHI